jgi:hypothetical protein
MEIKYTIEILTKDIQDIEKLVGNLSNSMGNTAIELDLALSKIRNVYEILTMIKADRLHEMTNQNPLNEQPPAETLQETKPEEPAAKPEPEPEPEPEPFSEPARVPEAIVEPEPEKEAAPDKETKTAPEPVDRTILAEKFSKESSINENLAEKRKVNVDAKLMGQPIDNIIRNIGINDRFLIIRELFKGDSDQFNNLVGKLDRADSYEDATRILKEQFSKTMDHEGVEILSGLVKRRHIR